MNFHRKISKRFALAAFALFLLVLPEFLSAYIERPKFNVRRFEEDWSVFCDQNHEGCFLDRFKYIELNDCGSIWVGFGGQLRVRTEFWENFGFGPDNDDTFVLGRAFLHGDLHLGEHVRIFVEGKSAFSSERDLPGGKRTLDVDEIDLENAFIELGMPFADCDGYAKLRVGRQQLLFGKQRLVSPLAWANTQRTFDGISAIVNYCDFLFHGFYSKTVPVKKYDFNTSSADAFYGLFVSHKNYLEGCTIEGYFYGRDRSEGTYDYGTEKEERYTLGARFGGRPCDSCWYFDVEGAYQFGDFGPMEISAWMFSALVGYQFVDCWAKPKLQLGIDYASGNEDGDEDFGTFSHLFPLGHAYLGWIDIVGRQNIIDLSPAAILSPCSWMKALIFGHFFWRDSADDALYNAGAGVARSGSLGSDEYVGAELDILFKFTWTRYLSFIAGYSHFFAGKFIDQAVPASSSDIDFGYVGAQFTF